MGADRRARGAAQAAACRRALVQCITGNFVRNVPQFRRLEPTPFEGVSAPDLDKPASGALWCALEGSQVPAPTALLKVSASFLKASFNAKAFGAAATRAGSAGAG